jgi:pantoate--beta-alanine ligase
MKIVTKTSELQRLTKDARDAGKSVGLVPTMGALHAGHISLVERARRDNDIVVVSVFVNPTQFNNPNDLSTYPRTVEADMAKLEAAGVDIAFVPTVDEVYPEPDTRQFDLGEVASVMEGPMRPGHVNGVAQIVSKLFAWSNPTRAYFGEKDFQQIAVIRRMADIEGGFNGLEIVDCPIVREADGLAMSSRNVRLTPEQRAIAPAIHRVMADSLEYAKSHSVDETKQHVVDAINAIDGLDVEYYEIVHPLTMQPVADWTDKPTGCITVYCGDVRLIDNIKYDIL